MIEDVQTVMWKEIREIVAMQGTAKGGIVRFVLAFGLMSIYFPVSMGRAFVEQPMFLFFYIWFPMFMGIGIVLDSFAGERERHTLETLLASRLSDRAIFSGKLISGVLYSYAMTLLFIVLGLAVVNIAYWNGQVLMFSPTILAFALVAALLVDTLFGAIGVLISLRAPTVRQGSETLMVVIIALAAVPFALYLVLPKDLKSSLLDWLVTTDATIVGLVGLAVLALACLVALYVAMLNFRRSKLILE
jgi:ABC-2 type transport system permease protein